MVRKEDEQGVYRAVEREQWKTLRKEAFSTCLYRQVCTQVTGMSGSISRQTSSQAGVLSRGERGILCGISVDKGLDEYDHGPDYDGWEFIDEGHRQDVWNRFRTTGPAAHVPVA